ncbi:MAG: adenosylcobinamide-GDP ribazoletransferase [Chloroflexi bacterium]|nr:adenosylcobinamide-GDP ribazoletransferase [Chloroflexota bacterium]
MFPTALSRGLNQAAISDSRAYFPLVGLLLGGALVGLEWGAGKIFPPYLTAALLLVFLVAVTRGLHLDGLMDVCDGLFGGFTRERRLEIMRDSNVGAFAVAGAVSVLLLKYGALLSLLSLDADGRRWSLLLFPSLSRWSMVLLLGAFPYVREQGLGSPFHQGSAKLATSIAGVVAILAAVLIGGIGGAGILLGVSVLAWLLGKGMVSLLGGLTGDTYGAANEVTEVAALVAAVALVPHGWIQPLPIILGGI